MTAEEYIQKVREVPGFDGKFRTIQRLSAENGIEVSDYIRPRPKKADRTKLIVTCPRHGTKEIAMRRFTERGIFWCSECEANKADSRVGMGRSRQEERSRSKNRTEQGGNVKIVRDPNTKRSVYLALSKCRGYVKVGVTGGSIVARILRINAVAKSSGNEIEFTDYSHFTTNRVKAALVEGKIKRSMSGFVQSDLVKFPSSQEVLKVGDKDFISRILGFAKELEGQVWKPNASGKVLPTYIAEGEIKFSKWTKVSEPTTCVGKTKKEIELERKREAKAKKDKLFKQKVVAAKLTCEKSGTEVIEVVRAAPMSKSTVTKRCKLNPAHISTCKIVQLVEGRAGGCKQCSIEKAVAARLKSRTNKLAKG